MSNLFMMLRAVFRHVIERREGNVAMIFGLCMIPVVIAAGMAVDVTRAYMVKSRLAAALDAAALAVGSESNSAANSTLQTDLQKYFFANYPASALGQNVTVNPIPPTGETANQVNLGQDVTSYQAQATVPMTFMQIIGFNSITVTAVATTQRNLGLEVALVLDNTGSMLCGDNDGAPTYMSGTCPNGTQPGDTVCKDPTNKSRICTLRNAATDFVNILTGANPPQGELYISVVPYVTTVNVAQALCNGRFACTSAISNGNSNGTDISCGPNFEDQYGFIVDQPFAVYASTTAGSPNVTIQTGTPAYNPGGGQLATNVTSTSNLAANMAVQQLYTQSSNSTNAWDPMPAGNFGNVIPNNTTIASITDSTHFKLSANATSSATNVLLQFGFVGTLANTSPVVTNVDPGVASVLSNTSTLPGSPPLVNGWSVATTTATGIPTGAGTRQNPERGTTISSVTAGATAATTSVTLCQNANAAQAGATIMLFNPVYYDASSVPVYNTGSGNGPTTPTNPNSSAWMGCVIEPTDTNENSASPPGVLAQGSNPDVTEPTSNLNWYPFWWLPGDSNNGTSGLNNWVSQGIKGQTNANPGGEIQGAVTTDWDSFAGPNQGCPVPMLPLTDVTDAAGNGKQTVLNAISSMWPRDAGGTQVAVGMIWGWRVLSPTGPFPQNNGHPMTYTTMKSSAWKKVVILMTDGTEEWPSADQLTGMGFLQDGKLGTTNFGTISAQPGPLDTRLQEVCQNMAATNDFVIYTVGLGSDGASNSILQNCPTGGGYFVAADTGNVDAAFQKIANSILNLRLTQ